MQREQQLCDGTPTIAGSLHAAQPGHGRGDVLAPVLSTRVQRNLTRRDAAWQLLLTNLHLLDQKVREHQPRVPAHDAGVPLERGLLPNAQRELLCHLDLAL